MSQLVKLSCFTDFFIFQKTKIILQSLSVNPTKWSHTQTIRQQFA